MVAFRVAHLTFPRGVSAAKTWGSLSPPAPLSCGAPLRWSRGDPRGAASLRFPAADAGNPSYPAPDAAFRDSL